MYLQFDCKVKALATNLCVDLKTHCGCEIVSLKAGDTVSDVLMLILTIILTL